MTRHEIKFSLSKKSIRQAINALEAYKKELKDKCNLLSQRLAENGVEIARAEIVDLDAVFSS